MQPDKIQHLLGGFIICVVTGLLLPAWYGLCATILAGLAKEIYDHFRPNGTGFDIKDLAATCLGGVVGYLILIIFK